MKEPRVWQTVLQREQWFPWKQRQVKFTSKGSFFLCPFRKALCPYQVQVIFLFILKAQMLQNQNLIDG